MDGGGGRKGGRELGREGAREWWGGREQGVGEREGGREQGREEAMMLGRQRASLEEGRVEGGGFMKGTSEEGTGRGMDGEGRSEGRRDWERKGVSKGAMEGNFKGGIPRRALASIQCIQKSSHNSALAIATFLLQMKNSEQV